MFTLSHFASPPPESIKNQIMQLVIGNVTDISAVAIAPSNPLYRLYQYGLGLEVNLYQEAMDGSKGIAVELIVALDEQEPSTVLGFLLYLPAKDDPQACAVAYMAVLASRRRQGIARAMITDMLNRYPHAELACFVAKVPYFAAMGFQVLGARGPQVVMNSRDHATDGLVAVLDTAPIYRTLEVRQIHTYLLQQHGKRVMVDAEKQRDRNLDILTRRARMFVEEQLSR